MTPGMGAKRFDQKEAAANAVWRLMAGFSFAQFQHGPHQAVMREHGLTPGHLKALMWIDPRSPLPMRAMAEGLDVDASMVTWLVDRLEEKGLVERLRLDGDRRQVWCRLTKSGAKLLAGLDGPVAALDAEVMGCLAAKELATFVALLARVRAHQQDE